METLKLALATTPGTGIDDINLGGVMPCPCRVSVTSCKRENESPFVKGRTRKRIVVIPLTHPYNTKRFLRQKRTCSYGRIEPSKATHRPK